MGTEPTCNAATRSIAEETGGAPLMVACPNRAVWGEPALLLSARAGWSFIHYAPPCPHSQEMTPEIDTFRICNLEVRLLGEAALGSSAAPLGPAHRTMAFGGV